jgi:hypothetical protein
MIKKIEKLECLIHIIKRCECCELMKPKKFIKSYYPKKCKKAHGRLKKKLLTITRQILQEAFVI